MKDSLDLFGREGDGFAECVDADREALLGGGGDQLVHDLADIMGAAIALLGRERVKRKQGRNDADGLIFAEFCGDPEQPQLARRIEAVAGLDLDGRAAAAHQRMKAPAALLDQFIVGRRRGVLDRGSDSATGGRNLLIGCAGATHRVLVGAGAAEDEMGVAVDQARRDPGAAERDHFLRAKTGKLGALADTNDIAVLDADRTIFDDPERIARLLLERCDPAVDEQPVPHVRRLRRGELLRSKRWRAGPTFQT